VVALGAGRADVLPAVALLGPVLAANDCGDATDSARESKEAADAAEATAARAQRIEELAADPAHVGAIEEGNLAEAEVGLGLEESGAVPGPIRRSPREGEEFIDASGQAWDVKAFRSQVPNARNRGAFTVESAMDSIRREVRNQENVMLDTRHLTAEHVAQLREAIDADPSLGGKVLFYP
jgi:hypothetical protein